MQVRSLSIAMTILAACSNSTIGPISYTVLVSQLLGPLSGPDLWKAADSAAPASWSVPVQGWDTLNGGQWCIQIPTTERVVVVTDTQPGASQGWVGYLHLSPSTPHWSARDSIGKVVFAPGPPC
jgi:hypothetical protein